MAPTQAPSEARQAPFAGHGTRSSATGSHLVRRTLSSFARLLETVLSTDAAAGGTGLLQRVDPRAKVVGLLGLVVVATLVHGFAALLGLYTACCGLALLSRVPARRLMSVWLAVPLFTAALMLPALLNLVSPGEPVLVLWRSQGGTLGPWHLPRLVGVTDSGLLVSARMVLRATVTVSLVSLLTTTTPAPRLLRGLRALGVPQVFVMVLMMMERYLSVLVRAAEEIHLAKLSRSLGGGGLRQEHAWLASGMGSLFRRTQSLGDAVYQAMISRGYTGEVYLLEESRWRGADWCFLALCAGLSALALLSG
ncbi:MAG TPA: cobalt ECF transporter T component CbiQ [Armatimonadota bacterium]|jgi:cobalt ECF transporter T component CbiQ